MSKLVKVSIGNKKFKISNKEAKPLLSIIKAIEKGTKKTSKVIYKEYKKKRPKGAIYLKGVRQGLGIDQLELARISGFTYTLISKYENGARKITEPAAKKLAKALGLNPKHLLN